LVKIFRVKDVPEEVAPDARLRRVVNEKTGSEKIGVIIVEKPPKHGPSRYHYHTGRESVYVVLEGRAEAKINGKIYPLEPGMVVLISPNDRHKVTTVGNAVFKMVEVYSPLAPDFVEAPAEDK